MSSTQLRHALRLVAVLACLVAALPASPLRAGFSFAPFAGLGRQASSSHTAATSSPTAAAAGGAPSCPPPWQTLPSPRLGLSSALFGVAGSAAADVWAVGATVATGQHEHPLLLHWDGRRWLPVLVPISSGRLYAVAALRHDDAWAVGATLDTRGGHSTPLLLHWNGLDWRIVAGPALPAGRGYALRGLAALSASDIWAVGGADGGAQTLIEHYDGQQWSVTPSPNGGAGASLQAVSAASPTDVWAVGTHISSEAYPLVERWDGHRWTTVSTPLDASAGSLSAVVARTAGDVWVAGAADDIGGGGALAAHWDGHAWHTVSVPDGGDYEALAAIAAGDVWGVGASGVIEHYDGASWQITLDASAAATPSSLQPHAVRPRIAPRAMGGQAPQGAMVARTRQSVRPHSSSGSPPVASYSIIDLGTLSGGTISQGNGVNAIGQVVGYSYASDGLSHAIRTAALNPINPATDQLDAQIGIGSSSDGYGLNDLGQAVGDVVFPAYNRPAAASGIGIAFRTAPNSLINPQTDDLGTLGGSTSVANGINNAGQAVGYADIGDGIDHAFRTAPNSPINPQTDDLGTLGGSDSYANGINISGQVVGYAQTSQSVYHAFRTAPNSPINPQTDDLGTLGGSDSYANGINSAGQVVGYAQTSLGVDHAFLTGPNQSINPGTDDLGTLPGDAFSYANGVNDSGQVAGTSVSNSESSRAFLWQNGQMIDLNTLLPPGSGWSLYGAQSINYAGQITGYGSIGGQTHAFLMVPTSYNGLAAAYNNAGTTDDSGTGLASFDGGHASYSAQTLAAAGIVPDGTVSSGGMTFQWPSPQPPALNNVIAQGQTIDVIPPAGGQTLAFLGAASNGATSGIGTITYSDGSTQSFNLGFSDWTLDGGGVGLSFGNTIVATLPYRNLYGSGPEIVSTYLFGASVALDPSKVVTSVTLPQPQPLNQGQLHIFAMAITAPQIRITPSSLDFGGVAVGTTSQAQTVTIANVGTATLSISSIATSGPHGGDFTVSGDTCSGQAIATGGSCSVNVSFTPSISGTETASLSISDNVTGSPQSVSLTGVGVQPPTAVPTTAVPTTAVPTTAVPTTAVPTTAVPTTSVPTTAVPTTPVPTTAVPTTAVPTTAVPTTAVPPPHTPTPIPPTHTPALLAPTHTPTTRPTDTPVPPTAALAPSSTPTPTSVPTVLPLSTPDAPDAAGYPDALLALAVLAPGDVWAVGSHYQPDASGRAQVPLILHYAGGGLCTAALPASRSVAVTGQPGALSVDEQAGRSFVRNADGSLSVLDSAHDTLVRTVSVGGAAGAPLVVDAQAGRVIAADPGSGGVRGSVSILDARSGRVVATITHGLQHPVAIALDASSGRAFVVDMGLAGGHGAGSVTALNVSTGAVVGRIPVGRAPTQALVDGSRRRVYVLNAGDGTVSTLDVARGRRLRTTAVGDLSTTAPGAAALDARRGLLYVGHTLKHGLIAAVGVLDERTGRVRQSNLRACQANDAPRAIGADTRAGRVFVACDRVYVLDAGGKVLRGVDVGAVPDAIAVDEQKGLVFVTALAHVNSSDDPNGPGLLSVLNARDGRVLATAVVGWGPVAVLVDTKRRQVVVANSRHAGGDTSGSLTIFAENSLIRPAHVARSKGQGHSR